MVRLPDPDSEIESLNEFKSTVMAGRTSDDNSSKRNALSHNFLNALVEAAKPAFSIQDVPQNGFLSASELRERYAEEDVRNYREEIDEQSAILNSKRERRQGKLTVIREIAESVAQPQGDSF